MNRRRWLILVIVTALPFFFLNFGTDPKSAIAQFYGFGHLLFFAFMAWWLSEVLDPASTRYPFPSLAFLVILAIFGVGGLIELIQPYFSREAQWRDLGIDLLGGMIGIGFLVPARRQLHRAYRVTMQVLITAAVAAVFYSPVITLWDMAQASRQFPVLGDFETAFESQRWSSGSISDGVARHGDHSLKVELGLDKEKRYHGTTLRRGFGDWRDYTTFAFSVYNPDEDPLDITVSIRDREHWTRGGEYQDRFNQKFTMRQGWNDILIPVGDIQNAPSERQLHLDQLDEVTIFTVSPPKPRQMYLDYVRLIG